MLLSTPTWALSRLDVTILNPSRTTSSISSMVHFHGNILMHLQGSRNTIASCERSWEFLLLSYVLAFLTSSTPFFITLGLLPSTQSQITPPFAHYSKTSLTGVGIRMTGSSTGVMAANDKYPTLKFLQHRFQVTSIATFFVTTSMVLACI